MSKKQCNEGLDDRCRDQDGQIRAKNGHACTHAPPDIRRGLCARRSERYEAGHADRAHRRAVTYGTAQEGLVALGRHESVHAGVRGALHHSGHGNYAR